MSDIQISNWQELLLLTAQCYEVTGLGYLGCDIVVDRERGPLILELNARPGLSIQIANDTGLLTRLTHIEGIDTRKMAIEERVEYAKEQFSPLMREKQLTFDEVEELEEREEEEEEEE